MFYQSLYIIQFPFFVVHSEVLYDLESEYENEFLVSIEIGHSVQNSLNYTTIKGEVSEEAYTIKLRMKIQTRQVVTTTKTVKVWKFVQRQNLRIHNGNRASFRIFYFER